MDISHRKKKGAEDGKILEGQTSHTVLTFNPAAAPGPLGSTVWT